MFEGIGDTRPRQVVRTWAQLCMNFASPLTRREKDGWLFSPAKYRAPRRLIANVIELSLLVLEVDGAWRCEDCGHQGPLIMFRNARHEGDRCPACKKRNKKLLTSPISQIHFDGPMLAAACRKAFPAAFALYSTHSHKLLTDKNPLAEPRFRIVIPLTEPVPVADFLELWHAAVDSLKEVPADPQVKDPNRIFYTPVKMFEEAPYEFHIEPGGPLDWKRFLSAGSGQCAVGSEEWVTCAACGNKRAMSTLHSRDTFVCRCCFSTEAEPPSGRPVETEQRASDHNASTARSTALASTTSSFQGLELRFAPSAVFDIYASHESRHEELCRRIMARGKQNTRGNYDARCLAHNGKGTTALFLNPRTGAVSCNRGCSYEELLVADGLDDRKLPSAARFSAQPAGPANLPSGSGITTFVSSSGKRIDIAASGNIQQAIISLAKLHVINALLLAHLFDLTAEDEKTVRRYWGDPRAEEIEWPGSDDKLRVKVCSFPSRFTQLLAAQRLSKEFDLEGVPGFYQAQQLTIGPDAKQRRDEIELYGPWRLALDHYRMKPGALLAPFDNGSGYICGIRIFRNIRDHAPFLLTSRGLPGGAKAVGYKEVA